MEPIDEPKTYDKSNCCNAPISFTAGPYVTIVNGKIRKTEGLPYVVGTCSRCKNECDSKW